MSDNDRPNLNPSARPWARWLVLVFIAAAGVAGVMLFFANRHTDVPPSWASAAGPRNSPADWLNIVLQALIVPMLAGVFGVLILQQQPRHRIGWLLIAAGIVSAAAVPIQEWAVRGLRAPVTAAPGWQVAAWITNWIWIVFFSIILLTLALFPAGRFLSRRWQIVMLGSLALFLIPGLIATAIETPLTSAFQIANPFVQRPRPALYNALFGVAVPFMLVTALIVLATMIVRFRRGSARERDQIKWLVAGVVVFAVLVLTGVVLALGFASAYGGMMVNAAVMAPLIGVGIAMLRHHLYDIDVIIRRTTAYAVLTALLAAVYFGSVILLQRLLTPLTGDSTPAVVLSTLLIAALFLPLRRRVQQVIDRRFFRRKYDAEQVLARFAATVRDETDLDALTTELTQVIEETMQPASVSVWLRPAKDERP